jgi:hypothetical protein
LAPGIQQALQRYETTQQIIKSGTGNKLILQADYGWRLVIV